MTDIEHFKTYGYVVIQIFDPEEIIELRKEFHKTLLELGIDHDAIITGNAEPPPESRGKSSVSDIFYPEWKLKAQMDNRIYNVYLDLMHNTFSSGKTPGYEHPLGASDDILPYIDRVCYRLPDHIRCEGGLKLHIDRNPTSPYNALKFRPIQSFIALVDHYGNKSGGLQLVPKFHQEYTKYFTDKIEKSVYCKSGGEFFRMHGRNHDKIRSRLETISIPAGSVVFWDNRLPHATCEQFESIDSREVIYFSYLPAVELNKAYYLKQMDNINAGIRPPAYDDNGMQVTFKMIPKSCLLCLKNNNYLID